MIKCRSGLDTGSLIDVNSVTSQSTAGAIWIGGSTSQNPLPILPFGGSIVISNAPTPGVFGGEVKVVGCAETTNQPADICFFGGVSGSRPVRYFNNNCTYHFVTSCSYPYAW